MGNRGRGDGIRLTKADRDLIQERLEELEWTQRRLAKAVKKAPSQMSNLLNKGNTSQTTLRDVARVLGLEFQHLLPQLEFEFQITRAFISDAQQALGTQTGPVILRGVLRPAQGGRPNRRKLLISSTSPGTT